MRFRETGLSGVFLVVIEPVIDDRGEFARVWCDQEARQLGIEATFVQSNVSRNRKRGTLRGMHFQIPPHSEGKLVTCLSGAVYDVVLDLRPDSPTRDQWIAVELSADTPQQALYIPPGLAHGFQTLADESTLHYQMTSFYRPASARGIRWNDPRFQIQWPIIDGMILSERDRAFPDYVNA